MMNAFFFILGILLLLIAIIDLLWTILWVDGGAGPVSSRLTTLLWNGLRKISNDKSRLLSLAGPLILTATLFMWVGLMWAGWTFLFAGAENSLIDTRDQEPITWAARIYFVAYSMFTMGNGDFSPKDGFWQIATSFTTASGMLFVTLGVSYVLSVLGGVTQKRSFAEGITGQGKSGVMIVKQSWNGEDCSSIDLLLKDAAAQLSTLTQQHKAYPILHYYHSQNTEQSSAVAVAILDEALSLFKYGIPETKRPNKVWTTEASSSVQSHLSTLNSAFIKPADSTPPLPELSKLQTFGLPTKDQDDFEQGLSSIEERRKKLLGMIQADAWDWPME
ncbi:potassium channel family protein [Planococcus sp. ISL-110]|uniref:ion channel n=1 Tax=Planococcus sp. ISL-110 TaxID=2819167 RepID=UPI001BE7A4B3|nr:potassium channel family protein [Planococcus sp. ISL-110]MBT2571151.1 two pore domain potassium channel family protein [Planococcus sp. ISL-110]